MSIQISLAGRLGRDPEIRETQSGKAMTTTFLVCDINDRGDPQASFAIGITTFGTLADRLTLHAKGDPLAIYGELQQYTNEGGTRLSVLVKGLHSAAVAEDKRQKKTGAKPRRKSPSRAAQAPQHRPVSPAEQQNEGFYDDPLPF